MFLIYCTDAINRKRGGLDLYVLYWGGYAHKHGFFSFLFSILFFSSSTGEKNGIRALDSTSVT